MKYPVGWPSYLIVRKVDKADPMGGGATYEVVYYDERVATLYRSSRGWAYASDKYGSRGQGYSGYATLSDAMFAFGLAYDSAKKKEKSS